MEIRQILFYTLKENNIISGLQFKCYNLIHTMLYTYIIKTPDVFEMSITQDQGEGHMSVK